MISSIIPTYNEEHAIGGLLENVKELGAEEVIVADGDSAKRDRRNCFGPHPGHSLQDVPWLADERGRSGLIRRCAGFSACRRSAGSGWTGGGEGQLDVIPAIWSQRSNCVDVLTD